MENRYIRRFALPDVYKRQLQKRPMHKHRKKTPGSRPIRITSPSIRRQYRRLPRTFSRS